MREEILYEVFLDLKNTYDMLDWDRRLPALTINPHSPIITFNFHVQSFETQTIQDSKPLVMNPIEVPIEGLMAKFSGNGSLG